MPLWVSFGQPNRNSLAPMQDDYYYYYFFRHKQRTLSFFLAHFTRLDNHLRKSIWFLLRWQFNTFCILRGKKKKKNTVDGVYCFATVCKWLCNIQFIICSSNVCSVSGNKSDAEHRMYIRNGWFLCRERIDSWTSSCVCKLLSIHVCCMKRAAMIFDGRVEEKQKHVSLTTFAVLQILALCVRMNRTGSSLSGYKHKLQLVCGLHALRFCFNVIALLTTLSASAQTIHCRRMHVRKMYYESTVNPQTHKQPWTSGMRRYT